MNTSLTPDKLYFKKQLYIYLLCTVIFFTIFIPFCIYIADRKDNGPLILIIGSISWFILCPIILYLSKLWIKNLSYVISDNSLTINEGIFTKIEQNIPNSKVTDFVLYRDLFDRFLGIGSIKVQTAGGSGQMGYEGILNGLINYKDIHENLRNKLVIAQTSTINESVKKTNFSNDIILDDILSELRDINKKLN